MPYITILNGLRHLPIIIVKIYKFTTFFVFDVKSEEPELRRKGEKIDSLRISFPY